MTNELSKEEKVFIFYRESLIQSIVSDIFTFGILLSALWINFIMLGNNWITTVFIIFMWFMWLSTKSNSKGKRFTNKKDLQKFLENKDD